MADNTLDRDDDLRDDVTTTGNTEPATKHDVTEGGVLGAVGGAIVGGLAGGPLGAVIGAIAGGAASAGAVDVVDKHDHDYARTAGATDTNTVGAPLGTAADTGAYDTTGTGAYADTTAGRYTGTGASSADTVVQPVGAGGTLNDVNTTQRLDNDLDTDATQRLQLREEQLAANTQQVQAGEVRVHKDVITETQSIDVPVTREEVVIERHPVNSTLAAGTAGDIGAADQEIRIPVMEEQVTLEKTAVVREEVEIGKRQVTDTQHLTGTVRHEELRVDDPTAAGSGTTLNNQLDEDELDENVRARDTSRTL